MPMRDRDPVSVPDAIRQAALFPEADLPDLPADYPSRRVLVEGVFVRLPAGLPVALVSPERIEERRIEQVVGGVRQFLRAQGRTNAVWFVQEEAFPNDLAERLQTLGMRPSDLPGFEPRDAAMAIVEAPPPGPAEVLVWALVRARWDTAVERGTPALTVGAGSMSRPILERLGFSTVGWSDCLLDELSR